MNIDEQIEEARVAVKEAREAIRKDGVDKYNHKECLATYNNLLESQRQERALAAPAGKNTLFR